MTILDKTIADITYAAYELHGDLEVLRKVCATIFVKYDSIPDGEVFHFSDESYIYIRRKKKK